MWEEILSGDDAYTESDYVRQIIAFVMADTGRHFLTPK